MEHPAYAVELPARAVELPARALEHPARALEHPARAVEHPACAVEHPARAVELPARALEHLEIPERDSAEARSLNIPAPYSHQRGLKTDPIEGNTVPANPDRGTRETREIVHESASALIGSLNTRKNPCKSDYKAIKLISSGGFGAVHLVRHKDTNQICAMKKMDKQNLRTPKSLEQAFMERDIATFADCPFVASMFCSFATNRHLCMVMEYAPGGDCGTLLCTRGPLPVPLARLYIAETVVAVEYLHSYGVVHRDLKPENLLITSTGHIKVTDFGISKVGLMRPTSDAYKARTKDLIREFRDTEGAGTSCYMAPEIMLMKGYGRPVDWWSVGIILFKFLFGVEPFTGSSDRRIFRSVLNDDIPWTAHNYRPPQKARGFITELLRKDPAQRLGTGGANEIKMHPFLSDLDFDNLLSQKPLFIPDLKSEEDTRYFNTGFSAGFIENIHMDSDEEDTSEDHEWPEVQHFVSSSHRLSKLCAINTEMMSNEEPMSPPRCSPKNRETHSEMQKESPISKPEGDKLHFIAKNSAAPSPSFSESPAQKGRKSAQKLRKQQKPENGEEEERRRGSIFRRMVSSCRHELSRAARSIRESLIFTLSQRGSIDIARAEKLRI
ncbi:microtubule-associated serine/threonine-protein kinase 3-like isoform 2-T2 [Anomaloglossus baeobatrachus]